MKSEPRTRLAPQRVNLVAKPQSQPSLGWSGGCLFSGLCLLGSFLHDNCDRPLLDMESNPHKNHLLIGGWSQPPACLYERPSLSPVGDLFFTGIPVFR